MNDIEYILNIVRVHKRIATDIMNEFPVRSPSWLEARGSVSCLNILERTIENLIKENSEV